PYTTLFRSTWSVRAIVFIVKDSVTVSVNNRTSVIVQFRCRKTGFIRTSVFVVTDSVAVIVRTTVAFRIIRRNSRLIRTSVNIVFNSVTVAVFVTESESHTHSVLEEVKII